MDEVVPILHTKMLLLGEMWWHDEDGDGGVADVTGFAPQRLWLGSANGTTESRSNLEFGIWLREPELLRKAKQFLGWVLSHSEALDPDADDLLPDLVEPDYDDDAFYEYMARFANDQDGEPQQIAERRPPPQTLGARRAESRPAPGLTTAGSWRAEEGQVGWNIIPEPEQMNLTGNTTAF